MIMIMECPASVDLYIEVQSYPEEEGKWGFYAA